MIKLNTYKNKDIYELNVITDNKDSCSLIQYLVQSLIDGKYCTVTTTTPETDVIIINNKY